MEIEQLRGLYIFKNLTGEEIEAVNMIVFGNGEHVRIQASPAMAARFMWMAGKPFKEPIVPYGPFVMNTMDEIERTLRDYQSGQFP